MIILRIFSESCSRCVQTSTCSLSSIGCHAVCNVRQPKRCLHVSCGCGSNPTRRLNMAEHSTHLTLVPTQPPIPAN
ncbi:hypothetical protein P167DRAFT_296520 [Morchella conica CCBAS932]|uniref:Uncharacterized protein n=1 Tax=Morchella conica CCBAS932 TaxID=1392247 RepID=A0A3N4KGN4_9PEZI|nr:hypothetical protein P167DRAFT_296520 [Morchella conica CCBAS932]